MLPDSPSLDYLRRQAKDLLIGLRETRPSALLADAQTALARNYGFRSWPELKAEVDRRRGRADIAGAALTETIANRFGLGAVTAPMRSLAQANEVGRPWALETDSGRWAVKQLNRWVGVDDIVTNAETDVRLQEAAADIGLLLPRPVRSIAGAVVESIQDHNWRVNAWIESGPPLAAPVSKPIAAQAGSILARLHGLALPPDRPMEPWYRPLKSGDDWAALVTRASAQQMSWTATLQRLLPDVLDLTRMCATVEPPTPILCYCGFGPHNTRVARDGQLALLGWEHASAFPPSWELAGAIMGWTVGQFGDAPNAGATCALLDAYRAEAGHMPALDLTCFSADASAWLNYVYGQLCVALDAKNVEDRDFMDRHVSHMLAHAPSRAFLEGVLEMAMAPA